MGIEAQRSRNGGVPIHRYRKRFWIETSIALFFGALTLLTFVSPEWIEELFGLNLDNGNGSLEWAILATLAVGSTGFLVLARREHRFVALKEYAASFQSH